MALTFGDVAQQDLEGGSLGIRVLDVTFDSSYPTGGEAITAAQLQLASILFLAAVQNPAADTNAVHFAWDAANSKLMCFRTDQVDDFMEQIPDTTNLATVVARVFVVGLPEVQHD